jgi:hypothetical protein
MAFFYDMASTKVKLTPANGDFSRKDKGVWLDYLLK